MPPSLIARLARVARVAPVALTALLAAACDDSPESAAPVPTPPVQNAPAYAEIKWLDIRSGISPEQWLASRSAKTALPEDDPQVKAMRVSLAKASQLFAEKPRMIANRAVQIEEMLSELGIDESATEIIETLMPFGSTAGGKLQVFGSVGEHYVNLRQQGLDRKAAVKRLQQGAAYIPGGPRRHG